MRAAVLFSSRSCWREYLEFAAEQWKALAK
jgi:hypothetical protein